MAKKTNNGNGKRHATPQSLNGAVKSICDIMRRSNVAGAMNYVPELAAQLDITEACLRKRITRQGSLLDVMADNLGRQWTAVNAFELACYTSMKESAARDVCGVARLCQARSRFAGR